MSGPQTSTDERIAFLEKKVVEIENLHSRSQERIDILEARLPSDIQVVLSPEEIILIAKGEPIRAIKSLRDRMQATSFKPGTTGLGLKDAKDIVDRYYAPMLKAGVCDAWKKMVEMGWTP